MALLGIKKSFKASHGSKSHEHTFQVEIVVEGKINSKTGYIENIDCHEIESKTDNIINLMENKNLKEFFNNLGFKSSGMESIAMFFLKKLNEKFPIKFIRVWETEDRYVRVYPQDI